MDSNQKGVRVLVAGSVLQLIFGIIYVWSVFVVPVSEYFAEDVANVKLTTSFMLSFFVLGILAGGKLQVAIGTAKVTLGGGILLAAGMLATSFISPGSAWIIYITYGIVGGFGVGMGYNAIISCGQKWFPHKRGLATGISVCAFGFSTVIFAPLVQFLIGYFTLINTFRILAAVFFAAVITLFHFIQLPDDNNPQNPAGAELLAKRQYTTTEMIKTSNFYLVTLSLMFGTAAYFILNPSFKTMALQHGLDDSISTVLVMVTGIANALGRLGIPLLSDKLGREKTTILTLLVTGLCAISLIYANGYLFLLAVALIAFCYGGYSGIYPLITADQFGIKNIGSNYGTVMVGFMLSALFFPILIKMLQQELVQFTVLAVLAVVGAGLIFVMSARSSGLRKQSKSA